MTPAHAEVIRNIKGAANENTNISQSNTGLINRGALHRAARYHVESMEGVGMKDRTAILNEELKKDGLKSCFDGSKKNNSTGKNKSMGRPREVKK